MTVTDVRANTVDSAWFAEVRELARDRDAVLLAHNYQLPEIQDVAHHTGDSLAPVSYTHLTLPTTPYV